MQRARRLSAGELGQAAFLAVGVAAVAVAVLGTTNEALASALLSFSAVALFLRSLAANQGPRIPDADRARVIGVGLILAAALTSLHSVALSIPWT